MKVLCMIMISVDRYCPDDLHRHFNVLSDDEQGYYACALNIADVVNNCNKSYIMQLLDRRRETFVLFSRFGRVGQVGQMNTEIFVDKDLAIREFQCLFQEKTGVKWSERYTDVATKKGKYQFILMKSDNEKTLGTEKLAESVLVTISIPVQQFIKTIYDPELYGGAGQSFDFDTRKLPLGSLGLIQIEKASKIIEQINALISPETGQVKDTDKSTSEELSSLFYTSIPSAQAKLKPLVTRSQLEEKGDLLDLLRNMCHMSKNVDKSVMEKYSKLETTLTHVEDRKTAELIDRYLKTNTGGSHKFILNILDIYKIDKPKEAQAYRKWDGLHNKQLLWHGTRMANAVGILSTGLRINPAGVPTTGKMFGNGLYFANSSTKSAGYMGMYGKGQGILFLCEVALGNMYERLQAENVTRLPDGKHSTKGLGNWQPDTESHVEIGDVTIPIGKLMQRSTTGKALQYDEFIVYDSSQIKMRYAVVVDYIPKW